MPVHKFEMFLDQAKLVHKVVADHTQALKNWIASAVEANDFERATKLVAELREYEKLYAGFNMDAKEEIAKFTGKPLETEHRIKA